MNTTTLTKLRAARAVIADEKNWTRFCLAEDSLGGPVEPQSPTACRFCAIGALCKVAPNGSHKELRNALCAALPSGSGRWIGVYNDHPDTTHADVLALFDRAIAAEERKHRREVFDKVRDHLLAQGKQARSRDAGGCAYRGDGGTACAVGCLISDEVYSPHIEGPIVGGKRVNAALKESGVDMHRDMLQLLIELQNTHDRWEPRHWAEKLEALETLYFGADGAK